MEEVLEKCIKPFLLGKSDDQLYLVKLGKEKIDYEQELRIQAEKERKKRDKIAKQYADNLVLAMGPAERAYQDYFGFTETLTQEERKWEKNLFGKNRAERAIKAKQYQKELEKDQRIASQDPIERKQKQTWLLNSYFRELPEEKARFSRLLLEYRKSGEVPFSTEYLSDHLIDFFYKMKAFEFEIAPEQVRDFLKKKPAGRPSLISTRKLDRRNSPQLPQTIFRTISDMSNTYRVNFMVGVIVPPNNIKQSMKAHLNFKTFL